MSKGMDNYHGHYFDSFTRNKQGEVKNQYYDPFYVKHRKRTTKAQLRVLENTYETCPRPDSLLRKKLGDQLGMTPRSVQVWFQNRRAKVKKQQQSEDVQTSPFMGHMEQRRYKKNIEDFDLYPTNNSLTRVPFYPPVRCPNYNNQQGNQQVIYYTGKRTYNNHTHPYDQL